MKKLCCFLIGRVVAAAFFFPDHLAVFADFKDASASFHEGWLDTAGFLDGGRHTVGFRAIISLDAIFDFDVHEDLEFFDFNIAKLDGALLT